jgi:uncharacterized LabA/DUF88 family protein
VIFLEKAAVFIDGGYLSKILKGQFASEKIDYSVFSDLICNDYKRLRTYYYDCLPYQENPPTEGQKRRYADMQKFITALDNLPRFEVRLGKLTRNMVNGSWKYEQKRVDVLFSVDLVRMSWAHQIEYAVIVTGDSDYVPAVKAAKDAGITVKLCYNRASIHNELFTEVDERYEIDQALIDKAKSP